MGKRIKICVVAIGAMRFSVCGSVWDHTLFNFKERKGMEINDLKKYLKEIITLESAAFEYSQYISAAEKNAVFHEPKKKVCEKPVLNKNSIYDPKPYYFDQRKSAAKKRYGIYLVLTIIIAAALLSLLLIGFSKLRVFEALIGTIIVIAIPAVIICIKIWEKRNDVLFYLGQKSLSAKEEQDRVAKENEQKLAEYNKNVSIAEEEYKAAYENETQRCKRANELLEMLKAQAVQIKALIKKYYDMDVIFPKYRNFSAICSFYEYFMTERCSVLSGSDGAYNLYESEKTMGHIVNAVDSIANMTAEALNMMKENQYYFYNELHDINYRLSVFNEQLDAFLGDYTKTNDYFLQIADNTKALTYDSAAMLAGFGY